MKCILLLWVVLVVGALLGGTLVCWVLSEIIEFIGDIGNGM